KKRDSAAGYCGAVGPDDTGIYIQSLVIAVRYGACVLLRDATHRKQNFTEGENRDSAFVWRRENITTKPRPRHLFAWTGLSHLPSVAQRKARGSVLELGIRVRFSNQVARML